MHEKKLVKSLSTAIKSGNEFGWHSKDIETVASEAKYLGLACLGAQVQFIVNSRRCEAYWLCYEPRGRQLAEDWDIYVNRTWTGMLTKIKHTRHTEYKDAAQSFKILSECNLDWEKEAVWILYFTDK